MLGKMQYRKEKHFQSLTSSSQPIALQKVQIKKITVMLGHDCLKTLRKISKALFKVNLEDRAMMENGTQWNIIFLKTTHTHTHTKQLQVGKTLLSTWNFHYVLRMHIFYVLNCISDNVIPAEQDNLWWILIVLMISWESFKQLLSLKMKSKGCRLLPWEHRVSSTTCLPASAFCHPSGWQSSHSGLVVRGEAV